MKADTIKAIFTNLLFVIGIILLIVGFTQGALAVTRIATFDQYPLPSYEETRCQFEFARPAPVLEEQTSIPVVNEADLAKQQARCEESLANDRKLRQTEDIVTSVSMLFSGFLLVMSFKRFILK